MTRNRLLLFVSVLALDACGAASDDMNGGDENGATADAGTGDDSGDDTPTPTSRRAAKSRAPSAGAELGDTGKRLC